MIDQESRVRNELDRLVPRTTASPDWPNVVARSRSFGGGRRRRGFVRVIAPALAAAALLAVVLVWPFGGSAGTVLQRAAAAIGDGPVLHVVVQDGFGGKLVDLASGRESEIHQQDEFWYDPARGIHEI